MGYIIPDLPLGDRSRAPIRHRQVEHIRAWWEILGGDPGRTDVDPRAGTRTRFDPITARVCFGADVNPGTGPSPNERMSWQAVVAHELRHLQRHDEGSALAAGQLDEATTSLEAACISTVSPEQQEELLGDALQRLSVMVKETCLPTTARMIVIEALLHRLRALAEEMDHEH